MASFQIHSGQLCAASALAGVPCYSQASLTGIILLQAKEVWLQEGCQPEIMLSLSQMWISAIHQMGTLRWVNSWGLRLAPCTVAASDGNIVVLKWSMPMKMTTGIQFQANIRVNTGCTVILVCQTMFHTRPECELQELCSLLSCNACASTVHVNNCCVGFCCWLNYRGFVLVKHA